LLDINNIYNMDCLEGLKLLDDNSIDSIVTDPPYELGFMNKKWDNTGIAYNVNMWKECLRVLKPGGHLLAFGGSRTYHRMACAIEDAGFEIRDQIMWITGQGFPKSMDISKAIDKQAGAEREVVGKNPNYRAVSGKKGFLGESTFRQTEGMINITAPNTETAKQWNGWGTALKPAHEPIVVARKPLSEKTVADNVLKWGTGGINIDGCRVGNGGDYTVHNAGSSGSGVLQWNKGEKQDSSTEYRQTQGRFPANIILDEEAGQLLDEQSGITKSVVRISEDKDNPANTYSLGRKGVTPRGHNDSGGASRFFYCAKASKKERGESNNHPTVKPIKLIEYLVTLVTPPKGIIVDPFIGSGTLALACINKGFNYIGFELEKHYCEIAEKRINEHKKIS